MQVTGTRRLPASCEFTEILPVLLTSTQDFVSQSWQVKGKDWLTFTFTKAPLPDDIRKSSAPCMCESSIKAQ